ncbi:hypothetical protein CEQ90_14355 [Lewinellaceae bacterium SD302]|nr:hypothetical protein CEQ90_14355 [Lewinellaceae bacterium SD302]
MSQESYVIISDLVKWVTIIPFLIGVARFGQLSLVQKRVYWLVILYAGTEILASRFIIDNIWVHIFGSRTNLPLLHVFTALQTWFVLRCYRDYLDETVGRKMYWLMVTGFILFAAGNAVFYDGIFRLNPHARALQSFMLLPVAIGYLLSLLRKAELTKLETDPLFWFSAFVLLYFSGSFFVFLGSNYFISQPELLVALYGIHSILSIVALILFTIILWIRKRPPPQLTFH